MKTIAIIPARMESTRFPGKPLKRHNGKPIIQHVWEAAAGTFGPVYTYIATDSTDIQVVAEDFGAKVVQTSPDCRNGTERCYLAYCQIKDIGKTDNDIIVNIQGDLPLINHSILSSLTGNLVELDESNNSENLMLTLCSTRHRITAYKEGRVCVVMTLNNRALYFSRQMMPSASHTKHNDPGVYAHIGVYAYTAVGLRRYYHMQQTPLERIEGLEQLRWLQRGKEIYVCISEQDCPPVDTPEDLERIRNW